MQLLRPLLWMFRQPHEPAQPRVNLQVPPLFFYISLYVWKLFSLSFSPDLPTRHQVLRSALVVVLVSAAGALVTRLRPSPGNSASAMTRLATGKTFKCLLSSFHFIFDLLLVWQLALPYFWGFRFQFWPAWPFLRSPSGELCSGRGDCECGECK